MIKGIGTDIIDVERIARLCKNDAFMKKIFHENEIFYCTNKGKNKAQSLAARFAAKEAFLKALGTGMRGQINWNEIEVKNNDLGKPSILLHGTTAATFSTHHVQNIHLSLSHLENFAIAYVVLED